MSKELEALNDIKNHKIKVDASIKYANGDETQYRFETIRDMFPDQFDIIETALEDYERLLKLRKTAEWADEKLQTKKKLKVFEIIRKVIQYDMEVNGTCIPEEYEPNDVITKEEYDLLKEELEK